MSFISVHGKITVQILLEESLRHMQDEKVMQDSQYGFTPMADRTWPICWSFMDGVTTSVDKGRASDLAYLNFCKAFDMISYNVLISELSDEIWIWWLESSVDKELDG